MTSYLFFPGQGSQKIGMGHSLLEGFPYCKTVFEEVDHALSNGSGRKLSEIIWGNNQEELTKTENTQPALMAVSAALYKILHAETDIFKNLRYLAGHSLGEYSAYVAAESISLSDCAKLLQIRGRAMQSAVQPGLGSMAAILGLGEEKIAEICSNITKSDEAVVSIANFNSPSQIVISGTKQEVEKAMEECKNAGAKRCILLPVSAPFHCSLMKPAQERMEKALANTKISTARLPIISNVTVKPTTEPDEIRKTLTAQVTGQVRWHNIFEFIQKDISKLSFDGDKNAVAHALELGPGKVLTGLAKKCDISCINIAETADIKLLIENLNSNNIKN